MTPKNDLSIYIHVFHQDDENGESIYYTEGRAEKDIYKAYQSLEQYIPWWKTIGRTYSHTIISYGDVAEVVDMFDLMEETVLEDRAECYEHFKHIDCERQALRA